MILKGAPGTGKTHLAKEIAAKMIFGDDKKFDELKDAEKERFDDQCVFVQFHPSYDYTDFVEGLRPTTESNATTGAIAFERRNGVFKEFCERAVTYGNLDNITDEQFRDALFTILTKYRVIASAEEVTSIKKEVEEHFEPLNNVVSKNVIEIFERIFNNEKYIGKKLEGLTAEVLEGNHSESSIPYIFSALDFDYDGKNIDIISRGHSNYFYKILAIDDFFKLFHYAKTEKRIALEPSDVCSILEIEKTDKTNKKETYYSPLFNKTIRLIKDNENDKNDNTTDKKFVFIIDEINRGEISKIFGELFFAIDPGYRGERGKVKTQYQNLIQEGDVFYDGFYVPENVYIIGTMNDIDRSVEPMDFAMHRRFAWKEISPDDTKDEMGLTPESKNRMKALNEQIEQTEGLGNAYLIGGAYFLKLSDYKNDYEKLWKNHLEPLLKEYLRGQDDEKNKLDALKIAYDNPSSDNSNE